MEKSTLSFLTNIFANIKFKNIKYQKGLAMQTIVTWLFIIIAFLIIVVLIKIFGGKGNDVVSIFENIF